MKTFTTFILALFVSAAAFAGSLSPKDAHKAMFNVFTFDQNGALLGSGYGFFTAESGEAVASFQLFRGASRAEIVDWKGNRLPVQRILGASENYDLVRFTVEGKKISALAIGGAQDLTAGNELTLVRYTTEKKGAPQATQVLQVDNYDAYKYLSISATNENANLTCPLLDASGNVVAISQRNVGKDAETACAIDARCIETLTTNMTSFMNRDLQSIMIPKALPSTEQEAMTYIYMMGYKDSLQAHTAFNDFVETYPENVEGYVSRAAFLARQRQYDAAEADYAQALAKAEKDKEENERANLRPDQVHFSLSRLIYQQWVSGVQHLPEAWSLQRAYDEATLAQAMSPSPDYQLQQANCLFAMKKYQEAYDNFMVVCHDPAIQGDKWTARARTELWYSAARSLELAGGDSLQVLVLMDSVVAQMDQPYDETEARFLLERAYRLQSAGEYRRAINDYREYESTMGPRNMTDRFYYNREQLELECKMYQQALDDIQSAMAINPTDPTYPVEQAYILLRAGLYKETVQACDEMIQVVKDNPDYYKFRGIALGEMGKKREARESLLKAQSLGDPNIDALLERYK